MSIEFMANQGIDPAAYLRHLNTCFGHWGDERQFDWCFARDAGAGRADLLLAHEGGAPTEVMGGSAVVYRQAIGPTGARAVVGIMCGSFTLPAARGRGSFTGMIDVSLELATARGAALLVAFVTEGNPSRRRLEARGSTMIPTGYCVAEGERDAGTGAPPSDERSAASGAREPDQDERRAMLAAASADRAGAFHLAYADEDAWTGQHLRRALPTRVVELRSGAKAIVEQAEDTDRVLALVAGDGAGRGSAGRLADLAEVAARAAARGRKAFFFTSRADEMAAAGDHGYRVIPGFFTALVASGPACAEWLGARHETAGPALDAISPWRIEHGDRM